MWRAKTSAWSRFSAVAPGCVPAMAASTFLRSSSKRGGGRGHGVGAHQHHAIARGERLEVLARAVARHIHQGAIAGAPGHPRGGIEHDDVVAAGLRGRAEAQLRDREEQQRHADQLQEERPGLLDLAPARGDCGLLGGDPEAQRGDHDFAARAIRAGTARPRWRRCAEDREELQQREIQEIHARPSDWGRNRPGTG